MFALRSTRVLLTRQPVRAWRRHVSGGGVGLERKQRSGEDMVTLRRRLQYQMRKRGILETDLLLSTFASEHLALLTPTELADLDSLLSNIDWDIFYWATGKAQAPEAVQQMPVFQRLKDHAAGLDHRTRKKVA
ncbi:Succinate dehydrogenase assembly factor 2 mitochondrial [Coemansia sp. RSA 2673]|nr:Succinate dehydrogenase assembly factor 2 mitochondrial [Coemansia sp. RSA 2673]